MYPLEWVVEQEGVSLLSFLKEKIQLDLSKKAIKRAIDRGECKVNGWIERFSSIRLQRGDRVAIENLFIKEEQSVPSLLFEDDDFLILNKPKGLVCDQEKVQVFLRKEVILTHRLDKDTTGILVTAKNQQAKKKAEDGFRTREVEKKYLAVVDGKVRWKSEVCEGLLEKKKQFQGQTIWGTGQSGVFAKTHVTCLDAKEQASLLLCQPVTGRTHQIRVHVKELGHPILGDFQYAKRFRCSLHPSRMLLHAFAIRLPFAPFQIQAEPPEDFQEGIETLGLSFR